MEEKKLPQKDAHIVRVRQALPLTDFKLIEKEKRHLTDSDWLNMKSNRYFKEKKNKKGKVISSEAQFLGLEHPIFLTGFAVLSSEWDVSGKFGLNLQHSYMNEGALLAVDQLDTMAMKLATDFVHAHGEEKRFKDLDIMKAVEDGRLRTKYGVQFSPKINSRNKPKFRSGGAEFDFFEWKPKKGSCISYMLTITGLYISNKKVSWVMKLSKAFEMLIVPHELQKLIDAANKRKADYIKKCDESYNQMGDYNAARGPPAKKSKKEQK